MAHPFLWGILSSDVRLVRVFQGIWIDLRYEIVFVGKNNVILRSNVRLVRVFQGIWIDFSLRNGF